MFRKIFIITMCLVANGASAQDQFSQEHALAIAKMEFKAKRVIPPSPEAAELGKYGNVPVSLFTGSPKVSIPLCELKGSGIGVPVSLSYSASGFKPQDIATWTGLGWSLNAGGVITRSALANPDNADNYFKAGNNYASPPPVNDLFANYDYMRNLQTGINEGQPDIYYYNFGSSSGKFLLQPDQSVFKKDKNNIKITHCITCLPATSTYFIITDEQGITYEFREVEVSTTQLDDATTEIPTPMTYSYPSSWYLTKIISADGTESIDFTYYTISGVHTQFSDYVQNGSRTYSKKMTGIFPQWQNTQNTSTPPTVTVKRKYLQSATYVKSGLTTGYINFESVVDQRQDLNHTNYPGERLLQSVKMYSRNEQQSFILTKQYDFGYGYFSNANNGEKRLRLESVQEVPSNGTSPTKPPHTFEYNTGIAVPAAGNASIDHWGFYNGDGAFVSTLVPTIDIEGASFGSGANREPSLASCLFTTLNKIKYPTGGYTTFEYELHQAKDPADNNEIKSVGGIRIKQVTDYSFENKKAIVKNYEYSLEDGSSSGQAVFPVYTSFSSYHYYLEPVLNPPPDLQDYDINYITVSASSVTGLGSVQGSHVGYSRVTEYQTDVTNNIPLGKTVYNYNIESFDANDDHIANGDLIHQGVYDKEGKLLYEQTNTYSDYTLASMPAYKIQTLTQQDNKSVLCRYVVNGVTYEGWKLIQETDPVCIESRNYKSKLMYTSHVVNYQHKQLDEQTEKRYDQLSGSYITSTKKFVYAGTGPATALHTLPIRITENSSNTEEVVTEKKYTLDYTIPTSGTLDEATQGIQFLQTKNIVGAEIESVQYRQSNTGTNKRLINGMLTTYYAAQPYPKTMYRTETVAPITNFQPSAISNGNFALDSRYKQLGSFVYDAFGNLSEQSKYQDAPKAYIWDYQYSMPTAEVINAAPSQIAYSSFETLQSGTWSIPQDLLSNYRITGAVTGKMSINLPGGISITKSGLTAAKQYVVSYWLKTGSINITTSTGNSPAAAGVSHMGWTYYEHVLPLNSTSVTITGTANIDELRLHPKDAQMVTVTYDLQVGVTSQCSPNNKILYYEYDAYNRLVNVKDEDGNIVKNFKYNYGLGAALTGSPQALYYSPAIQSDFTKNNCTNGGEPTTLTYKVPYGRYISSLSPEDALAKAQADIIVNGQNYANQYGECRFYSVQMTRTFWRNDCIASGFGPPDSTSQYQFVFTVPARAFYSLSSVPAANALADTYLNAEGQLQANIAPNSCSCMNEIGKKYIANTCEPGLRVNDYSVQLQNGQWECYFHFVFSDGTSSIQYTDVSSTNCMNEQ